MFVQARVRFAIVYIPVVHSETFQTKSHTANIFPSDRYAFSPLLDAADDEAGEPMMNDAFGECVASHDTYTLVRLLIDTL